MPARRGSSMPDTSIYYHVAYAIALAIYVLYGVSLWVRRKRLREP